MIQIIGLMIGTYILTRMISFLTRSGDRAESKIAAICFGINIVITVILLIGLLASYAPKTPSY
jgi:hypothetical protein